MRRSLPYLGWNGSSLFFPVGLGILTAELVDAADNKVVTERGHRKASRLIVTLIH